MRPLITEANKSNATFLARLFLLCVSFLAAASASAQVQSYSGAVKIDPDNRKLSADLVLTVVAEKAPISSLKFYVNKSLRIDKFECSICSTHKLDTAGNDKFQFMVDSAPLNISFKRPLAVGKNARIRMRYSGQIPTDHPANMFTRRWTELALYDGWFPLAPDPGQFTFDITVQLPADYKVASSAIVSGGNGKWRLVQRQPTKDIPIIASPNLQQRVIERDGLRVGLDYIQLSGAQLERTFTDIRSILEDYTKWYGPASTSSLEFVLSERTKGGGYARPGLIVVPSDWFKQAQYDLVIQGWGHEIAHLWWLNAPSTSWEDWLNESFAEYSTLRYLRSVRGEEAFKQVLDIIRTKTAGKPAIWGINRNSPDATAVLYGKGPLCLYKLETILGAAKFEAFTSELHTKKINNTAQMLDLLEQQSSPEIRQRFEALLKM